MNKKKNPVNQLEKISENLSISDAGDKTDDTVNRIINEIKALPHGDKYVYCVESQGKGLFVNLSTNTLEVTPRKDKVTRTPYAPG